MRIVPLDGNGLPQKSCPASDIKPLNLLGKGGMLSLDVVTFAPCSVGQTDSACKGDANGPIARTPASKNGDLMLAPSIV